MTARTRSFDAIVRAETSRNCSVRWSWGQGQAVGNGFECMTGDRLNTRNGETLQ